MKFFQKKSVDWEFDTREPAGYICEKEVEHWDTSSLISLFTIFGFSGFQIGTYTENIFLDRKALRNEKISKIVSIKVVRLVKQTTPISKQCYDTLRITFYK